MCMRETNILVFLIQSSLNRNPILIQSEEKQGQVDEILERWYLDSKGDASAASVR